MSVQAMAWAIEQKIVRDYLPRFVLICLANYADQTGDSIYPSIGRLAEDTGLSERSVRKGIRMLEKSGVLQRSNPAIAAARITRADRRPTCYRLVLTGGTARPPLPERGAPQVTTGGTVRPERGARGAPDPSSDPSIIRETPNRRTFEEEFRARFGRGPADVVTIIVPKRRRAG